jgi:predicted nucleic acid-binding protein
MTFASIPAGSAIFLDANILVYHLAAHPTLGQACTNLVISQQRQLLSNDALIIAVMQKNGLNQLASHDKAFGKVPGITRFDPS